jgi:hypothetical protein
MAPNPVDCLAYVEVPSTQLNIMTLLTTKDAWTFEPDLSSSISLHASDHTFPTLPLPAQSLQHVLVVPLARLLEDGPHHLPAS